jgi:hypothetical protein
VAIAPAGAACHRTHQVGFRQQQRLARDALDSSLSSVEPHCPSRLSSSGMDGATCRKDESIWPTPASQTSVVAFRRFCLSSRRRAGRIRRANLVYEHDVSTTHTRERTWITFNRKDMLLQQICNKAYLIIPLLRPRR